MIALMSKYGAIVWTAWLVSLVVSFAVFETWALLTKGLTLSMFTWIASEHWPPIIFICGLLAGGLAVHFWWHWAPPSIGPLGGTGG
jgi:hypothetical protein